MRENSLLLMDLYELSMLETYMAYGMEDIATFEFFVRKLPAGRDFLMMAGVEQLVEFLETLQYEDEELHWLRRSGMFSTAFLDRLGALRFTGDLDAMPEGTVFFPDEPVLRVTAPLPQAQLVETRLINLIHFQTVIASTAARMVLAAPGKQLMDFGLRRAHGAEAGLLAARAAYLAGFSGTATLAANRAFGIPAVGTMAHSFVQVHDDEATAFERFARVRPKALTLLIDTYDTERGARIVATLAPRLAREGITVGAVRLDSGDLAAHARAVRKILDGAGLNDVRIFASGGLNDRALLALCGSGAPIDGFGIGTGLTTAGDAPALDCAYKLQEYAGRARRKKSEGKATWPGAKQVYRSYAPDGTIAADLVALVGEPAEGEPLLKPVIRSGMRCRDLSTLTEARAHAARSLVHLPRSLRRLEPTAVPVRISAGIQSLANTLDCARRDT